MAADSKELLAKSCFTRAPFHVVPIDANLVWAGSRNVKQELERITSEVGHDGLELSHLALIYGEYGSGKTHALKYFKDTLQRKGSVLVAYLAKPKVEKKGSFQGIVKEIIKQIGNNPLKGAVAPLAEYIKSESQKQLQEAIRNATPAQLQNFQEFSQRTLASARRSIQETLYPNFPELFNVFEALVNDDPEAWNYFASKPTKEALQRFELNSPIEDDHDALRALAAIYTILTTTYPEISETPVYDAAYLFVDEMEQFLEMKADEYQSIRTGLRDLFNSCTEHFCLILSATAENASLFHGILEEALMVRVTADPVHISSHDEVDDGIKFIVDLMNFARNGLHPPTQEHPFTHEALNEVVSRTTEPRTARKLIRNCNTVWQRCSTQIIGGGTISAADVQEQHGLI